MGAKLALTMRSAGGVIPDSLGEVFGSEANLEAAASAFVNLKGQYESQDELVQRIADMLSQEPSKFLVLAHLHRQLRFTNVELVNLLFDTHRLDDLNYLDWLIGTDAEFAIAFKKLAASSQW